MTVCLHSTPCYEYTVQVKRRKVEKRINEIVNRLNKTKTEAFPDLPAEQVRPYRTGVLVGETSMYVNTHI